MSSPVAVMPFWKDYDRKLYLRAAILADELGYDSFWIPEAWGYEVFALLTEIALNTRRIRLGTGIVNVFSRSEGLLAMTAATVDEISEGRLILGIGTSGMRVIEGFHGRRFDKPLTQVRDTIRVVKTLLAGGKLNESGAKLHAYRPFELAMTPARREIPIYVAALKENSIRSIGEMADGWIPTFWPYQEMARGRRGWVTTHSVAVTCPYMSTSALAFTSMKRCAGEKRGRSCTRRSVGCWESCITRRSWKRGAPGKRPGWSSGRRSCKESCLIPPPPHCREPFCARAS